MSYPWNVPSIITFEEYCNKRPREPAISYELTRDHLELLVNSVERAGEENIARTMDPTKTAWLVDKRAPKLDAHAALYRELIEYFIPTGNVLEVGCGPRAYVYAKLLSPQDRYRWWMVEINDKSMEPLLENPEIKNRVTQGSGYKLGEVFSDNTFQNIVGHSSYDSMSHIDAATRSVYDILPSKGRFLHVQDVNPGNHVIFSLLLKHLEAGTLREPIEVFSYWYGPPPYFPIDPIFLRLNDQYVLSAKYLHDNIAETAEQTGFRVVYNDTAQVTIENRRSKRHPHGFSHYGWSFVDPSFSGARFDIDFEYGLRRHAKSLANRITQPRMIKETSNALVLVLEKP